jgi:hypothetical protein
MKVEIKESLKVGDRAFKAPVLMYENMDEINKAAGSIDIPVARLNGFLHAHGSAADLRDLIASIVEDISKVKPNVKDTGKKNAKGEAITEQEKEATYVARVISAQPELFDKVQAELEKRAKGYTYKDENGKDVVVPPLAVDISVRVAAPKGPKKLAAKWSEVATLFLSGKKSLEKFLAAAKKAGVGTFEPVAGAPLTDPKNIESLGWLCKAYQDSQDAFKAM